MSEKEIWKDIPEYGGRYKVSNLGRAMSYSRKTPRLMSTKKLDSHGYTTINIYDGGKNHTKLLHRYVGTLFVPNPENKPYLNHINGDKTDSRASNLEWVTAWENNYHAREILGFNTYNKSNTKQVMCVETGKIFFSIHEAAKQLGIPRINISRCCRGLAKTAHGYHWCYVGETPKLNDHKTGATVTCVETKRQFCSYVEAANSVNGNDINLRKACQTGRTYKGFHWTSTYQHKRLVKIMGTVEKPVICVETGEVYVSAVAATNALNMKSNHISESIKTGHKCGGYHWRFATSEDISKHKKLKKQMENFRENVEKI